MLADLDVLATLPAREMRCGYAEIVKYGLLGDAAFFDWLEAHGAAVLARDEPAPGHAVGRSVEMKAEIVDEDERESGAAPCSTSATPSPTRWRRRPAFGEALKHGEAVALGCALAFRFSAAAGAVLRPHDADRADAAIAAAGLPTRLADLAGGPFPAPTPRRAHGPGQEGRRRAR